LTHGVRWGKLNQSIGKVKMEIKIATTDGFKSIEPIKFVSPWLCLIEGKYTLNLTHIPSGLKIVGFYKDTDNPLVTASQIIQRLSRDFIENKIWKNDDLLENEVFKILGEEGIPIGLRKDGNVRINEIFLSIYLPFLVIGANQFGIFISVRKFWFDSWFAWFI
jgi:hypothetical protein